MTDKAKTKADLPKATANSLTIPWPADRQGALMGLKRGGVDAVRRIKGDKTRMENFERGLQLLLQHARARFTVETEARETARQNAIAAEKRVLGKRTRELEARAEELQRAADAAKRTAEAYAEQDAGEATDKGAE